jgi:hypothetical protein
MRSRDLPRCGPGQATVVRVAEPDRRLGVGAVERVQEAAARQVRTTVEGRVGVVVDRQPLSLLCNRSGNGPKLGRLQSQDISSLRIGQRLGPITPYQWHPQISSNTTNWPDSPQVSPRSLTFSREQSLRQTFASSPALLAHYAMSRKIVVSSVSRQTMKGSDSVVAIGVRRHGVGRDNGSRRRLPYVEGALQRSPFPTSSILLARNAPNLDR